MKVKKSIMLASCVKVNVFPLIAMGFGWQNLFIAKTIPYSKTANKIGSCKPNFYEAEITSSWRGIYRNVCIDHD